MKVLYYLVLGLFLSVPSYSQNVYYLYFETENGASFYIKSGDKVISSNPPGYLILSNLPDSAFTLSVGINNTNLTGRFTINIAGRDRGYVIRSSNNGLQLVDLVNSSIVKPLEDDRKKNAGVDKRSDAFTVLLSKSASDASLLYEPVRPDVVVEDKPVEENREGPKHPPLKNSETVIAPVKTDTGKVSIYNNSKSDNEKEVIVFEQSKKGKDQKENAKTNDSLERDALLPANTKKTTDGEPGNQAKELLPDTAGKRRDETLKPPVLVPFSKTVVKKHSESSTTGGFGLVFFDQGAEGTDTIQLIIPNPRISLEGDDVSKMIDVQKNQDVKKVQGKKEMPKKLISDSTTAQATNSQTDSVRESSKEIGAGSIIKPVLSTCKAIASGNDFFRIRKNMAAKTTDELMVEEARRFFRSKCFTTEQIRTLSTLFLTSAGKYLLFDASYLHVSDRDQFKTLEGELRDAYYIKRFKTLVGEQ